MHSDRPDAVALCRKVYTTAQDPRAGGYTAHLLVGQPGALAEIEAIAGAIGDRPGGAEAWNALGDVKRMAGDDAGAIAAYKRAFEHRTDDDVRGRVRDAVGLYDRYSALDQPGPAMQYAGLAYQQASRTGDRELRGYVLTGVGSLLYNMGDLPAVERLVAEADGVIDETSAFWAHLRQLHGVVSKEQGRFKMARRELAEAAALARRQGLGGVEIRVQRNLVALELAAGDGDAAAAAFAVDRLDANSSADDRARHAHMAAHVALARGRDQEAIELTDAALVDAPEVWRGGLQAVRGRALARAGRTVEAEEALREAVASLEQRRAEIEVDALRPGLLLREERRWPFQDLFRLYVETGRPLQALEVAQRATARSVLDGLVRAPVPAGAARTVEGELQRAGDYAEGVRALARSLRSSGAAQPPDGAALLARLGQRHVLTYFKARDELWLIVVAPGAPPRALRVGAVADLRQRAEAWLAQPDRTELAEDLGARLLPDGALPAPGATLHIVVDDPVRELPFAALRRGGHFLVERYALAYVPSATVLAVLSDTPARAGPAVVIGDPRSDLPAARLEAVEIAGLVGSAARVGAEGTRAALIGGANAALIHVAAHTEVTPIGPALVLADGPFGAGDVIDRSISAQVVVLTSCASADPTDRDELGPLASAFLAAGTSAVVASRWAVGDEVALRFARAFYAACGRGDPVGATAAAQRQLIAAGVKVTSWATFVVLGGAAAPTCTKGAHP